MAGEDEFIRQLRGMAHHPAARGLMDDAAILDVGGKRIVLTHDTIVEGVHFLADDPPESVAWKLVATNLSDLAAKGATPVGALLSFTLSAETDWDNRFVDGLGHALGRFGTPLLGGDTVRAGQRVLGLTVLGEASGPAPSRSGAHVGDALYVTGAIGDAALGLKLLHQGAIAPEALVAAYRMPQPQLEAGLALAPRVSAMMDVSDGLLIDASRLAEASGLGLRIDLDAVPLSSGFREHEGQDRRARLFAATGGDDYQLLFTAAMPLPSLPCSVTRIGQAVRGQGLSLHDCQGEVPLPAQLGWVHESGEHDGASNGE